MCRGTEWQDVVCPGNTTERCLSQNINSNVFVTCVCKPGYFGEKCQHLWNPCDGPQEITENFHEQRKKHKVEVCENDGVCSPIYLNGKNGSHALDYRCDCRAGYTGRNCEVRKLTRPLVISLIFSDFQIAEETLKCRNSK